MHEWLIDSGCTYHMTPFKEILSNYRSENFGSVSLANEKICDVHGLGDACLIFDNGFKLILKNVRYVPDLAHNLISCSALEEEELEGKWGIKGYRLWLRCQPGFKVIISKDVTFNESEMPCLENSSKRDLDFQIEGIFNKVEENLADNQQGEELRQENQHNSVNNETETFSNSENSYQLARDRERRESRIPSRYKDFHLALNTVSNEPSSYEEALNTVDSEKWIKAMNEEIKALQDNNTWTLVPKPKDASVVDCKWIFKIKQENNTSRFKARLVAKGFTQKEGIDYTEIFAPVVKYTTVKIILALAAHFDWELKQMDVKTAFLHGDFDEQIYMCQPYGFINNENPDYVCLLKKSLYGLKQSPRQWNKKFDSFMQNLKFQKSSYDPCLYFKWDYNMPIFLVLYVDDMLIASPSITLITELQKNLCKNFEMKDLGNAKRILGMTIDRDRKNSVIFLNQKTYVKTVLEKFSMENAKTTPVPLAAHFQLSKEQSPKTESETEHMKYVPYSNAIGSVMYLMLQSIVALSTTEAEYIATTEAFKEAMWLEGSCTLVPGVYFGYDDACIRHLWFFGPRWKLLNTVAQKPPRPTSHNWTAVSLRPIPCKCIVKGFAEPKYHL
ncbi:UNVERIFIED_CONTAM: Retrovirus-related Pol polyprotein from transposon TNT 1-94 [Sesamum angustifolium]|uniref:Retrovirus-related Pol polyprotein from transposon TNT 1-94 n=1 Tax=Sesamum angustifolium TaxID=2727405 RepID=A0AAW2LTY0_9LAMI